MTEEDTFRILARPSITELIQLFDSLEELHKAGVLINKETREIWFNKHGWTLEEYKKSYKW